MFETRRWNLIESIEVTNNENSRGETSRRTSFSLMNHDMKTIPSPLIQRHKKQLQLHEPIIFYHMCNLLLPLLLLPQRWSGLPVRCKNNKKNSGIMRLSRTTSNPKFWEDKMETITENSVHNLATWSGAVQISTSFQLVVFCYSFWSQKSDSCHHVACQQYSNQIFRVTVFVWRTTLTRPPVAKATSQ